MGPGAIARAIGAILIAGAAGCQGPRPQVSEVQLHASPLPGRYRIEALVTNRGGGGGQVAVQIRLRSAATGRVISDGRNIELQPREQARLVADVEAPVADWVPEVTAEYPPR